MKPLYGMHEYTIWTLRDEKSNSWECSLCGRYRHGAIIENCPFCGTYPAWKYSLPLYRIIPKYLKKRISERLAYQLRRLANKLDKPLDYR